MKKGHQVTMKEIAKKLGVSVSTISRALKDSPELHPETKRKIVEMAKEMNYQPNLLAQSLRISRTKTLGVIVPEITSHFFASCISGIQDFANTRGYNIMICQSNESIDLEMANIKTLVSSQVDALLISLSRETNHYEHLLDLYNREIPFLLFDRVNEDIPVSKVTFNDVGGAYEVTKHLLENGCKKVMYVSGPEDLYISKKRKEGYMQALEDFGVEFDPKMVKISNLTTEGNIKIGQEIAEMKERPDGVFCMIDPVALDILAYWKEKGIRVPQDMALAGFTNNPSSAVVEPSLTTVAQPGYEMGKLAVTHLLDQLDGIASDDPISIVLDTTLLPRKSTEK
ncbi:LacI family DNA-binding transcriptional regulator [Algoriphagus halophytocola]|uniref:LacI family transcriptional regulator n=1 Tax=Algoriphagus halophytocola TaxID=2991499 RepID=A0ABY6MFV0_9BACT|nr:MULTISPECIES: LacI family DNA-binding transcriptional regulator [unclassified Algoriphagus]UZD22671.1 LacI family transcriptional regulator [Algoriphagus sp. TR-M5]WBL43936.1 LacI family DNA-binding transcriptional regulator [Algoriphagus sp. TR-M9]